MITTIAITLGDVTGIGPEVALKALATELGRNETRYIVIGSEAYVSAENERHQLGLAWTKGLEFKGTQLRVYDPMEAKIRPNLPSGAAESAHAAMAWLEAAVRLCLTAQAHAIVTAPVNKEAIIRAGYQFVGQTEFLSTLARTEDTGMMLLGADDRCRWLRVMLATTHLPLKEVAYRLTQVKVERAIRLAALACRQLGLPRARVGVAGLNPHAGEGGLLGTEEQSIVGPAVQASQKEGHEVVGPLPADTLFYQAFHGAYDAVVAMYHDQGLVPLKMIAFDSGVNWTVGLPFARTSPDHGTAYDIAGRGLADPSSMQAALRLAVQLSCSAGVPPAGSGSVSLPG